jgi:light-regulated signal transduction histidine kinase (bacteriophytochrome)
MYPANISIIINDFPELKAGRTAMIQLMQNLICNAIKFKGTQDPEILVSAEEAEQDWIINVKDNGIGIDPEF